MDVGIRGQLSLAYVDDTSTLFSQKTVTQHTVTGCP